MSMKTAQPGKTVSIVAGSDLSATPYRFVTTTSGKLALCGAGLSAVGVLTDKPNADGKPGSVTLDGIEMVEVGGSVTVDDIVKSDASGKAVTASSGNILAGQGLGRALATASSGYIPVLLNERGIQTIASGSEALTTAATASAATLVTTLSVTGTVAYGLADGKYVGQRKIIRCIAVSGTPLGTVTPTTVSSDTAGGTSPASVTFTVAGQEVEYEWLADGWKIVRVRAAGVETVSASGTANLLYALHLYAVADTVTIALPNGWCPGQRAFVAAASNSGTPVGTTTGLFYDEDGSADGVNIAFNAAADQAACEWLGARWHAFTLVSATVA